VGGVRELEKKGPPEKYKEDPKGGNIRRNVSINAEIGKGSFQIGTLLTTM